MLRRTLLHAVNKHDHTHKEKPIFFFSAEVFEATFRSLAKGRRKELPFVYNTYTILYALNMNETYSVSSV